MPGAITGFSILFFPLIKLAKKLKGVVQLRFGNLPKTFPLIKLAKKLKVEGQFQRLQVDANEFPLIKLAKKLKVTWEDDWQSP